MIVVVDYGMGNLRSVSKALEAVGASVQVSGDPLKVSGAAKIVLPGVGAFPAAMRELKSRGLLEPVKSAIAKGVPYLGICLGLQLLFDSSEEGAGMQGLGVLPGYVRRFSLSSKLKIPHMGWNRIYIRRRSAGGGRRCPLIQGIPDNSFFYFVHSYYVDASDASMVALESDYGRRFTAMVWNENVYATQFHPEKSQGMGLRLLENFVRV